LWKAIDEIMIRVATPAPHAHDLLSGVEEEIRDADTLIEQAARISAKVEDKSA
jgi:hypothetical protein